MLLTIREPEAKMLNVVQHCCHSGISRMKAKENIIFGSVSLSPFATVFLIKNEIVLEKKEMLQNISKAASTHPIS